MMAASLANFSLARYGDYIYPDWANYVGWSITMGSSVVSFVYIGYRIAKQDGNFLQVSENMYSCHCQAWYDGAVFNHFQALTHFRLGFIACDPPMYYEPNLKI